MTYAPPTLPSPQPQSSPISDERQMALIVYIAYLCAHVFPILSIVGVILAYISRETAPDWLKSHYTFQIRTFWIGLLYWAISILLCIVVIGVFGLLATLIWGIVRCGLGLNRLMLRQPYPNPDAWIT